MSITTWIVPRSDIPGLPSSGGSGFSFVPGGRPLASLGVTPATITGGLDRLIDPGTRDYVRTANGEWVETQDSRTIMLIAMSVALGESPFDPTHGSTIARRLKSGVGYSPDFLLAETLRVGAELQQEGILSDLRVNVRDAEGNTLVDRDGHLSVHTEWRDLASGSPINAAFTPR